MIKKNIKTQGFIIMWMWISWKHYTVSRGQCLFSAHEAKCSFMSGVAPVDKSQHAVLTARQSSNQGRIFDVLIPSRRLWVSAAFCMIEEARNEWTWHIWILLDQGGWWEIRMLLIIIRHRHTAEDGWTKSAVGKLCFVAIYPLISLF